MFLATTGLLEFWDKERELLYLGSWCLRPDRRREWEGLKGRLLPSPWEDRGRFREAARSLEESHERLLAALGDTLNRTHGVRLSARYWRILVGPWLLHHLHAVYDRYEHLRAAFEADPALATITLNRSSYRVPRDGQEFIDLILDDPYNLQIISGLLEGMGHSFPSRALPAEPAARPNPAWKKALARASRWGRKGILRGITLAAGAKCRAGLYELPLTRSELWGMAFRSGFRVMPLQSHLEGIERPDAAPRFDSARNGLRDLPAKTDFERLFVKILPDHLPTIFLEGFASFRAQIAPKVPALPPVLVAGSGWYFHDPFQFLAAEAAERGTRLVANQHGGGYGLYETMPFETHESRSCDSFLVWGWANGHGSPMKNAPALPLAARRNTAASSGARDILFVTTTNPRYLYRFYSAPQGTLLQDYFEWQRRFLRAVPPELRPRVLFHPHRHKFGHGIRESFSKEFPWLRWNDRYPFSRNFSSTRLVVIDHIGTPLLEAMAANVPTMLFWKPEHWEIRAEARPEIEALRQAGCLYHSPEEAAGQLARRAGESSAWWEEAAVQQARSRFADRYALVTERGVEDWLEAVDPRAAAGAAQ